jgi:hypothetical protein
LNKYENGEREGECFGEETFCIVLEPLKNAEFKSEFLRNFQGSNTFKIEWIKK